MKNALVLCMMALLPACALAVDGVVLINQSTVMAAGGFPYILSQAGSYKLSGNLTMSTTIAGNFSGLDIAIGIRSSNVNLDLNGFSIVITNSDPNIRHIYYAIAELGTFSQVSVSNGNISINSVNLSCCSPTPVSPVGVYLHTSLWNELAGLSIIIQAIANVPGIGIVHFGNAYDVGQLTSVRHGRFFPVPLVTCPSLIVENVGAPAPAPSCVDVNNVH